MRTSLSNFRNLTRAVLATLPLFSIGGSLNAMADDSIWSHNGSTIRWVSEGERQTAYYIEPREGLLEVGVHDGEVLFEGSLKGSELEGRAFVFKRGCQPEVFPVRASKVSESEIILEGLQPVRGGGDCQTTSNRKVSLLFQVVRPRSGSGTMKLLMLLNPHRYVQSSSRLLRPPEQDVLRLLRPDRNGTVTLDTCANPTPIRSDAKQEDLAAYRYTEIARYHALLNIFFTKLGLGSGVWEAKLDELAKANVDEVARRREAGEDLSAASSSDIKLKLRPLEQPIEDAIREFRIRKRRVDLPEIVFGTTCSDNTARYFGLQLDSPEGRIELISEFYYRWCRIFGFDPSSDSCDFWVTLPSAEWARFGQYRYRAKWEDGKEAQGRIDVREPLRDREIIQIAKPD
jgi:hypothetical protein